MGEKHVLAVNLTREWEARRPQFLAVGLFPSVLLVTSKQLIDHMKNEKGMENGVGSKRDGVGGQREFVLVFQVEDNWMHAIFGGLWQYEMDVFLVDSLAYGDGTSPLFTACKHDLGNGR